MRVRLGAFFNYSIKYQTTHYYLNILLLPDLLLQSFYPFNFDHNAFNLFSIFYSLILLIHANFFSSHTMNNAFTLSNDICPSQIDQLWYLTLRYHITFIVLLQCKIIDTLSTSRCLIVFTGNNRMKYHKLLVKFHKTIK